MIYIIRWLFVILIEHVYSLKRHNYTHHYLDSETGRWSSLGEQIAFRDSEFGIDRETSGVQAPPVFEGLGDKMLTRVFSPACWSQTNQGEVTRRNLRQPTSTGLGRRTKSLAVHFALLCFTLLDFALHERPKRARRICLLHTAGCAVTKEQSVTKPRPTDRCGNLRAICACRRGICPSERDSSASKRTP